MNVSNLIQNCKYDDPVLQLYLNVYSLNIVTSKEYELELETENENNGRRLSELEDENETLKTQYEKISQKYSNEVK